MTTGDAAVYVPVDTRRSHRETVMDRVGAADVSADPRVWQGSVHEVSSTADTVVDAEEAQTSPFIRLRTALR